MSIIEKLEIVGIRSFGTKEEDQQSIHFYAPLTLILGANGCGKTTIIECLKYAITGEVPPGSNRGQSFIHDPKIFDAIECLGQVKLMVRNANNERLIVTRSMKIGYKRQKLSFETLDATVNFQSADNKNTFSKRCADVDAELCHFMGVSKAIINNVIFCHQEDSSWPLDEAKKLKEKFDAIFGTTEYNKVIDKILKMRKEQQEELKLKEESLKYLNHIKKQSEDKSLDLHKAMEKVANLQSICSQYDDDLKPINEKLGKLYSVEREIGKLQSKKVELTTKLNISKEQSTNLASKIKTIHEGTVHQIDRELRNFGEKLEGRKVELENMGYTLNSIKNQEKQIQATLADMDRKRGSLVHQKQKEQDYISERAKKIYKLCALLNISAPSDLDQSNDNQLQMLETIKAALVREDETISSLAADHEKHDVEMQIKLDKLREKKTSIESEITLTKSQHAQLQVERRELEKNISSIESEAQQLVKITRAIEKVNGDYNDCCQNSDLDGIKKSIAEKRQTVETLQSQVDKLDKELAFLNSVSKLMAEINLKEKELEKREQEIKRIKSKHEDDIKKIIPDRKIDCNYKRNLQTAFDDLNRELKEYNEKINGAKLKERELQLARRNQKEKLAKNESELEESKEKLFEQCQSTPYEDVLSRSKNFIEKYQLDLGAFKSAEALYKKYIQKIEADPCCPLCHKNMSTSEASDLSGELADEIHRLPENIKKTESLLRNEQLTYEGLLSLKPVIGRISYLEEEVPRAKSELKATEENLAAAAKEVDSYLILSSEPSLKIDLVSNMLGDMSLLDEALKDVTKIKNELQKLKEKLPEGTESQSIEDVQMSKSTTIAELKAERAQVEKLQAKYEKDNETLNKLREKRNNLKDEQIKLQERVQALSQLKERKDEIFAKEDSILQIIRELQENIQPVQIDLNKCIDEKKKSKEENKLVLNTAKEKLENLKKIDNEIKMYTKELNILLKQNLDEDIERLKISIKTKKEEQTKKDQQKEEIVSQIDKIKDEISNHETLQRDLKDNKELKILLQQQKELQDEFDELNKDMGDLDYKSIIKQKEELIAKRDNITVKKGEFLGQTSEINSQINKLRNELNQTEYKDSIKNYRKIFYEVEVLKRVMEDMLKYRRALERALLKFHAEKMSKINRIIRELWRQIYRGNDIDYVEIQTEGDEKNVGSSDKRRNYNYKVVQSKHGSKIDMRGRCSAGQRVLASLIIRMALAETFSLNCGVLALDEPTTNLDRSNIISLCEALNKIVEERQSQSNFMLIIITHDEEFIRALGRIRNYYRVLRDDDGKSVIRKVRVT